MSNSRESALVYAEQGYPVFPCWSIDDRLACMCNGSKHCTPGKHPMPKHAPRGVRSATTDPAVIAEWPEDFNIALSASARYVCVDIDLPSVAEKLLGDEEWLSEHIVTRSGRDGGGCHIWCLVSEDTVSGDLRNEETGEKIGELRCDGQYAIVPPSRHVSGRQYVSVGAYSITSLPFNREPDFDGDGWGFARELLAHIDIKLVAHRARPGHTNVELPEAGIPAIEPTDEALGFQLNTNITDMARAGSLTEKDRSGTLWGMAKDIARSAMLATVALDPITLAGVIKFKDSIWDHPEGAKYADRQGYYLITAIKAIEEIEGERPQTLYNQDPVNYEPDGTRPRYYFDGFWLCMQRPRTVQRIANFDIKLVETITRWTGDVSKMPEESRIIITLPDGTKKELETRYYEDQRDLTKGIRSRDQNVIIEDAPLLNAMIFHSNREGPVPNRMAYGVTGWLPDQDAFLLPAGLVTADGLSEEIRWEPVSGDDTAPRLASFGVGMAPCSQSDLEKRLKILMRLSSAASLYPVLMQVLVAPLSSIGLREPAVLHIQGRTQVGKTSLLRCVMSIWGPFAAKGTELLSWTSTVQAIRMTLAMARDLPLVVDDFKNVNQKEMLNLVQQYADRTTRMTMRGSYPGARGVLLSTGEDVWGGQESSLARTVVVHLNQQSNTSVYKWIVAHAGSGEMAAIGHAWLVWMCGIGQASLCERFAGYLVSGGERAEAWADSAHQRMADTAAGLLAVDTLFHDFISELAPGALKEYELWAEQGAMGFMISLTSQAVESASYGAWETMSEMIGHWIENKDAYFRGATPNDQGIGFEGEIIGWCDDEFVYLTYTSLWSMYLKEIHKRGEASAFSWEQWRQEALDRGANDTNKRIGRGAQSRKYLRIPKSVLDGGETGEEDDISGIWAVQEEE